jgi:nickel-dependent lactate racemase
MTSIPLRYGEYTLHCELPGARVLAAEAPPAPGEPAELIEAALDEPIGSPPLEEIVRGGEQLVIVTSDITRYTGSEHYLPILLDRLNRAGVRDDEVSVVIALGIHRRQTPEEHRRILGPVFGRVSVRDHDCDSEADLVLVGTTADGIEVRVNRWVVEADRLIVTGTSGFHYFAGYSGGRKALVPGVASRATCLATHFAVFNPPEVGGKHPLATTAVLHGNPVHEALLQAARMLQPDFLLNTVLSPSKEILSVHCGDLEAAHAAACRAVSELYEVPFEEPADLAVVSCGGHPKDINFIQAHKSLDNGVRALRPGGTLVLLAACPDGFGNATFFDWFRYERLNEFEAALRANYEINGQTAHATLAKTQSFRVILVSELSEEQTLGMGMEKAADLQAALALARESQPLDARAVLIPDGGSVLPVCRQVL